MTGGAVAMVIREDPYNQPTSSSSLISLVYIVRIRAGTQVFSFDQGYLRFVIEGRKKDSGFLTKRPVSCFETEVGMRAHPHTHTRGLSTVVYVCTHHTSDTCRTDPTEPTVIKPILNSRAPDSDHRPHRQLDRRSPGQPQGQVLRGPQGPGVSGPGCVPGRSVEWI